MHAAQFARSAAVAVTSGVMGWVLHGLGGDPSAAGALPLAASALPAPVAPVRPAPAAEPLIAVSGDGNVTLRVEQQPLEWVLEQIAVQSGGSVAMPSPPVPRTARAPNSAPPQACAAAPLEPARAADRARWLAAIRGGDEASRYDALLQARSAGVAVPDETFRTLYETDASKRVRLLAFENYLESRSGDAEAVRSALQQALLVPSAAIQAEASKLLAQLQEGERIDAASPQTADP